MYREITVIIPISPIPSHPKTHIIEETIKSVRHHLPNSEIVLTFDGVRKEKNKANYEEHIRRILWKARFWGNITPYVFDTHHHQSGMMQKIVGEIKTPLILYVEQDTPLVTDCEIDWDLIKNSISKGESDLIRLYHEGRIPKEHNHLMIGEPVGKLQKTYQYSQRPHLASTAYYRRIISGHFSANSRTYIETKMHSVSQMAYARDGDHGWNQHKIQIYMPDKNLKRSYHLDGREGEDNQEHLNVY